jgi:protein TonB
MLAYAANRPRAGVRQSSPNTLLFIILGHIVLLAVAMSVKEGLPPIIKHGPTILIDVPIDKPPPPNPIEIKQPTQQKNVTTTPRENHPQPQLSMSTEPQVPLGGPGTAPFGSSDGTGTSPLPPLPLPSARPVGISRGATLLTMRTDLRPPYPQSKLLAEEESTLNLRLTIDEHGRVVAVDPIGRADPVFLASARRHLMAHWRYAPAMKDGQPIATSVVISLRFELDA